eukprot:gene1673-1958_t
MNDEGALSANRSILLDRNIDFVVPQDMYTELMIGYASGIHFVDKQLGRLLDTIDKLHLWNNLTIVLTADHGMLNGEKGMWEKWTLFDEVARVPLFIHHPRSPNQGQHYPHPVELIDIFPTLMDFTLADRYNRTHPCEGHANLSSFRCLPLHGRSLAPAILSKDLIQKDIKLKRLNTVRPTVTRGNASSLVAPIPGRSFALTQLWRCATLPYNTSAALGAKHFLTNLDVTRTLKWEDCSKKGNLIPEDKRNEVCVMGYSMRTLDFRYTGWLHFNRTSMAPAWSHPNIVYQEELYDHRDEKLADFTHRELENLSRNLTFSRLPGLETGEAGWACDGRALKLNRIPQPCLEYQNPVDASSPPPIDFWRT